MPPVFTTFLKWIESTNHELTYDDVPHQSDVVLNSGEVVDIFYYNMVGDDLGLNESVGIVGLSNYGYVARLGVEDREFFVIAEGNNIASADELTVWLDHHATLTKDSPRYLD